MYRKNTASQFICFQMLLTATGAVATGLSPAVRRCIDGTFAAGGGTVTEDGTTGSYKYAMSQADTNGNDISFIFSAATAMPVCLNIVTTAADPTSASSFGLTNLDAAISSRMATYTQPTGFLAATFPGTVASTTNITAGTVTTATNVTTVNGLAAGVITAAAIATDAIDADAMAADAVTEIQSGLSTLTAAGVRTAVGLASANLDTQLSTIDDFLDTEIAAIKTKTDQLTFTAANKVDANALAISGSTAAADNLEAGAEALIESTCAVGSTTTAIVTNLTEATDDHLNGRVITFITGDLAGQATSISDYNGTTKTLTVVALTEAPVNGDSFVIS